MNLKHYLLLAPEPGDSGSGPTPFERGDVLEEEKVPDPEKPDAEKVAADLTSKLDAEKTESEDKEKSKDTRIPAARHKEILEKEREKRADLERQLAQYQNGKQVADVNSQITAAEDSIAKMDAEYRALLVEGELDKAGELMSKIRRAERDMNESKSDMKIHAAEIRAVENTRYATTLERIENAYPELNPDSDDYNEETMSEVAELKDAYQMKGFTPTVALQKAVKALVAPRTTKQEIATNTTPRVTEKDVASERKAAAVDKTAKAVTKSPPSLNRSGQDHDKYGAAASEAAAIMNMSQAEFRKFSDSNPEALARMRGDIL